MMVINIPLKAGKHKLGDKVFPMAIVIFQYTWQ